ncbi:MAG: hypothetical protein QOI13_1012 [Paraburkholderia sp.]|nr:hypothetical protein [Paraburkholderia sp.]
MSASHCDAVVEQRGAPLRIVVVGGGFTGIAFIIHAIRVSMSARNCGLTSQPERRLDFALVEPAAELGRGIAYGTADPLHRINVPSDRMSLLADDASHATRWFIEHDCLDPGSTDMRGHHYVSRERYGAYVAATLHDTLAAAGEHVRFTHWRASAHAIRAAGAGYKVVLDTGAALDADRVALCFGHAAPSMPCKVDDATLRDPALIANPWSPGAFDRIPRNASVLVVGTGLTMADVAASLLGRDHRGPITAISRRGLLAQPHGLFSDTADFLADGPAPGSARALLRKLRNRIAREGAQRGWQPAVDALRFDMHVIWRALPEREQRRVARRLLPFWDVHRFRVAPQVHAAVQEAIATHRIVVESSGIACIEHTAGGLRATLRRRGGALEERVFDAIVLCTGPAKNIAENQLVRSLLEAGFARLDAVGTGLDVDPRSRLKDRDGALVPGLFAFGPMTRGTFGEMTGAPDIARHIERILKESGGTLLYGE